MINQIEKILLPITEFRKNMSTILENLDGPKVLMNRDKAQAVLVPYDAYKKMEQALEDRYDQLLVDIAKDRLNESAAKYIAHDDFWTDLDESNEV